MELKVKLAASLAVALVISILVFSLINPLVVWYLSVVPGLISCQTGDTACAVINPLFSYALPVFVVFICVYSVFEAI